MATVRKRERKKGTVYAIQVKVFDVKTNSYKTVVKTVEPDPTLKPKQLERFLEDEAKKFEEETKKITTSSSGVISDYNITFREYSMKWLEKVQREFSRSYYHNATVILSEVNQVIGKYKLREISPSILQQYFDYLDSRKRTRTYVTIKPNAREVLKKYDLGIRKIRREYDVQTTSLVQLYEGKTGEDLFYEQFRVIKSMQVEMFKQDGQTYIHSDRDGEAEEFYRLLNDKDFVKGLIKYRGKWDVISFSYYVISLSGDDVLSDPEIYNALFKYNSYYADDYYKRGLLTRDMLMDVASRSNFTADTLFYLPKEYCDDLDLILTFVDNANENNFRFGEGFGARKFTFNNLSEEVRSNPVLYERINKKALELNERCGTNFELLDVDNEISLGMGTHR